jgi:chromosome segregation ATPase
MTFATFAALPTTQPAPAPPPILQYTIPTAGLESQLREINRKLDTISNSLDQIESQLRGLRDLQPRLDRIQRDLDWERLQPRR